VRIRVERRWLGRKTPRVASRGILRLDAFQQGRAATAATTTMVVVGVVMGVLWAKLTVKILRAGEPRPARPPGRRNASNERQLMYALKYRRLLSAVLCVSS
jgi:hypothetical protein